GARMGQSYADHHPWPETNPVYHDRGSLVLQLIESAVRPRRNTPVVSDEKPACDDSGVNKTRIAHLD
ncbi:MAG TPA: hypothetical protein VFE62_13045, partial [Gemmataceae bacterium]|nr:hypothetical protein [Gemmataceae bacterium]